MNRFKAPRPRIGVLFGLLVASAAGGEAGHAQSGTLVVVNKGANTANIIDIASKRILATLPTGAGPHEVVVSSDGRWAVTTDYAGGNSLTVIDIDDLSVARTIDLSRYSRPHGIDFLPGDSLVAVTSEATRHVVLVRIRDGQTVGAIPTGQGGSHMLALVGDGGTIYTSNGQNHSVSQLDVRTGRGTGIFDVPPQPEAIAVTSAGDEVWVGSNARGSVSVIEVSTGKARGTLEGFSWPYRILLTPDGQTAIIPDLRNDHVRIVDRAEVRDVGVIEFPGAGPQGVVLSGDARTLFVSLSQQDRVAMVDLASRKITGYLPTGSRPDGIGFSPRRPEP